MKLISKTNTCATKPLGLARENKLTACHLNLLLVSGESDDIGLKVGGDLGERIWEPACPATLKQAQGFQLARVLEHL